MLAKTWLTFSPDSTSEPILIRPVWELVTDLSIRLEISSDAFAQRWARLRASSATTAEPAPASLARAASTAALRARILVWKAILS